MTTYLIIAAAVILALIVGFWLSRRMAAAATPQFVLDAEAEAWSKLEELLEFAASSKNDQKAISAAQQRIVQRDQRTAAFKAKVASL